MAFEALPVKGTTRSATETIRPDGDVILTPNDWQMNFAYTPENLPRILAMPLAKRAWPVEKQRSTAREKGMSRLEDARRIAAGEATATEVQAEDATFPSEVIRAAQIDFNPVAFGAGAEARPVCLRERKATESI